MPVRGVLLLVYFVASLPVCFFRPFYGILLWMVVSFLNPQTALSYWPVALNFPWALAVAIPTMLGCLIFCPVWFTRLATREALWLVLFWFWTTVTSILSTQSPMFAHHAADTWVRWELVSKIVLMTIFTMGIVNTFSRLRLLLITVAGCFGYYALKGLAFVVLTGGAFRVYGPDRSMIADNNDFGLAMNMTLPICFFLAQTETDRRLKWFFRLLCVAIIASSLFTYSRGALVGLVIVLLLMLMGIRQRVAVLAAVAVTVVFVLMLAPSSWRDRMDPTRDDAIDASARSRLNAWDFSWRLASDYPIAGGGYSTFTPHLYQLYADNPRDNTHGAHSIYFQVLAEHGFVGLSIYLSLILFCFLTTRAMVLQGRREGDPTLVHYANMFRFSLMAFLASGAFLGRAYFDYFFFFVSGVAVLKRIAAEASSESDAGESAAELESAENASTAWEAS
jgi:probable O-glycosylation ligase (exosortase A-associated)